MTKHIKIISNDKVIFDYIIETCSDCPCYHDGCGGEYGEWCRIGEGKMQMPSGYDDSDISPQCPLEDYGGEE